MKISSRDITGVVGFVPTPGTPDAGNWDAAHTVNLPETEKMIRGIVDAGTTAIVTTGTFGQGASLTWDELQEFVDCVVQTAGKKSLVFAGVTTLNTRDTIARARALIERGADGIFTGRPMWLALDDAGIVKYYRDLAAALPGVPLMVYDNPLAFKGRISAEAYAQLAEIPEIVASKHVSGPTLEANLAQFGDKLRILPLENQWYGLVRKHPDKALACWSMSIACGPVTVNRLAEAIARQDWSAAEPISEKIKWAVAPMFEKGGLDAYQDYSIPLGHVRFAAAGYIDPGPTRPPYTIAPDDLIECCRESGLRFRQLREEFAVQPAGTV
jgi:dihydrodipicolinate synthase/N-acetylneuraminate lyase